MTSRTTDASVPARDRRVDSDRVLIAACVIVPLIGLVLFFLYPMSIVFLRSITTQDGSYGLGNYAEVLSSKGFWRATQHSMTMGVATTVLSV
ncbi:MAG: ABC transporter permease, partial [Roseobacter sp.]